MIATTLFGGLGNQMFIYATVRAMALRNHTSMAFNLSRGFGRDLEYGRSLELSHFSLELPTSRLATFDYRLGRGVKRLSYMAGRNLLLPCQRYIHEDFTDHHFISQLVDSPMRHAYIDGYWQNPRYFEDFADVIRNDFTIKTPIPTDVAEELRLLQSRQRPLVFVGIRRYQEVKSKECRIKVCGADYYARAMRHVAERIANPLFVVFTQQPEWAREHLPQHFDIHYAREKEGYLSTISDLYLMRNCHHAVISNSTYYWWGAWLQATSGSHIVVAPDNFINPTSPCKQWTVLEA